MRSKLMQPVVGIPATEHSDQEQPMPRVVPSQVVGFIDQILGKIGQPMPGSEPMLSAPQTPEIRSAIELLAELPDEFLLLSGVRYSDYIASINRLKDLLDFWTRTAPNPIVSRQAAMR